MQKLIYVSSLAWNVILVNGNLNELFVILWGNIVNFSIISNFHKMIKILVHKLDISRNSQPQSKVIVWKCKNYYFRTWIQWPGHIPILHHFSENGFFLTLFQNGVRCRRISWGYRLAWFKLQRNHVNQRWYLGISGTQNDIFAREQNSQIRGHPEITTATKSIQFNVTWKSHRKLSQLQVHNTVSVTQILCEINSKKRSQ